MIEDINIGQHTGHAVKSVPCPFGSDTQLCAADDRRVALTLAIPGAAAVVVAPKGVSPFGGNGISLTTNITYIQLNIRDHGRMVCDAWFGAAFAAGTVNIFVDEVFFERGTIDGINN